jgi:ABC-type transport system involved in multi-copper enzyme maturation permease subunit
MRTHLRIIFTITYKDILDALKNKITLSIILSSMVMVLSIFIFPFLISLRANKPTAFVYDPAKSNLLKSLTRHSDFSLRLTESMEAMETSLIASPVEPIGLVIPAGFEQEGSRAEIQVIEGYYAHWADLDMISEQAAFFEHQLGSAYGQTVRVNLDSHKVYPSYDSTGQMSIFAILSAVLILIFGLALTPYLLVDEKEAHTLEALITSPARYSHILNAKATTGAFYYFLAATILFVFSYHLVVHWEIAILGVFLGSVATVGLGLLAGVNVDNPATLNLWMGVLVIVLIIPTILGGIDPNRLPDLLQAIMPWISTVAISRLFRIALAENVTGTPFGESIAILCLSTLIMYGFMFWKCRRTEM